jgi:hypothetical protein
MTSATIEYKCFSAAVLLLFVSTAFAQSWKQSTIDSVKASLDQIYVTDQLFRLQLDSLTRVKYKNEYSLRKALTDSMVYYDSINILKVKHIVTKMDGLLRKR